MKVTINSAAGPRLKDLHLDLKKRGDAIKAKEHEMFLAVQHEIYQIYARIIVKYLKDKDIKFTVAPDELPHILFIASESAIVTSFFDRSGRFVCPFKPAAQGHELKAYIEFPGCKNCPKRLESVDENKCCDLCPQKYYELMDIIPDAIGKGLKEYFK